MRAQLLRGLVVKSRMNTTSHRQASESRGKRRARFELVLASILLAFGLFVLPALIYAVGILLLGPYGEGAGMGRFYGDFFSDLIEPSGRAWALALGPLVLILVLRLIFLDVWRAPRDEEPEAPARAEPPREHARVEPRVSLD